MPLHQLPQLTQAAHLFQMVDLNRLVQLTSINIKAAIKHTYPETSINTMLTNYSN